MRRDGFGRAAVLALVVALTAGCDGMGADSLLNTAQYRGDGYRGDSYRDDSYRGRGYDRGGYDRGGPAPNGSYLRSCGNASVQGSTLTATCRGDRGRPFETSLDLTRCGRSDIGNNGGTLECAGARGRSRRAD